MTFDAAYAKYKETVPFPLFEFAKDLGVNVFVTTSFADEKSGEIRKEDGHYNIYLNGNHSYARNRFTLAHELAHFKLHKDILDKEKEIEDFAGRTTTLSLARDRNQERDVREVNADQLAADMLMPQDKFILVYNSKKTYEEVAKVFDVSTSAVQVRAQTIRLWSSKNVAAA